MEVTTALLLITLAGLFFVVFELRRLERIIRATTTTTLHSTARQELPVAPDASTSHQHSESVADIATTDADPGIEWIDQARRDPDRELRWLSLGADRHPASRRLTEAIVIRLGSIASDASRPLLERREAVLSMDTRLRRFEATCDREHISWLEAEMERLNQVTGNIVRELEEARQFVVNSALAQLEDRVEQLLQDESLDVESIGEADKLVDQAEIRKFGLEDRYRTVTAKLSAALVKRDRNPSAADMAYNWWAFNAAKDIGNKFLDVTNAGFGPIGKNKHFRSEGGLKEIAAALGGWDLRRLLPPTAMFVQSVYAEIFGKINRDTRPWLTTLMMQEPTKE